MSGRSIPGLVFYFKGWIYLDLVGLGWICGASVHGLASGETAGPVQNRGSIPTMTNFDLP